MTSYEKGFLSKCAEAGLSAREAGFLYTLKQAQVGTLVAGGLTGMYGSRNDYMANNFNNYSTNLMKTRNANLQTYRDKVDAGKAGTGLGRFWHGLMDNALGRSLGIRGSADYLTDKEVERAEGASALAQKDIERQNRINAAYDKGPQLDNLALSTNRGYTQQKSQTPQQAGAVNTAWQKAPTTPAPTPGKPATPAAPAATGPATVAPNVRPAINYNFSFRR